MRIRVCVCVCVCVLAETTESVKREILGFFHRAAFKNRIVYLYREKRKRSSPRATFFSTNFWPSAKVRHLGHIFMPGSSSSLHFWHLGWLSMLRSPLLACGFVIMPVLRGCFSGWQRRREKAHAACSRVCRSASARCS